MDNNIEVRLARMEELVDDIIEYLAVMVDADGTSVRRRMWCDDPAAAGKIFGRAGLTIERDEQEGEEGESDEK